MYRRRRKKKNSMRKNTHHYPRNKFTEYINNNREIKIQMSLHNYYYLLYCYYYYRDIIEINNLLDYILIKYFHLRWNEIYLSIDEKLLD